MLKRRQSESVADCGCGCVCSTNHREEHRDFNVLCISSCIIIFMLIWAHRLKWLLQALLLHSYYRSHSMLLILRPTFSIGYVNRFDTITALVLMMFWLPLILASWLKTFSSVRSLICQPRTSLQATQYQAVGPLARNEGPAVVKSPSNTLARLQTTYPFQGQWASNPYL